MPIRLRVAAVFAAALTIALAVGGWLLVRQLAAAQLAAVDAQLRVQLSQAGRYLPRAGRPAVPVAPAPGSPAPGEYVVQLIDPAGHVRGHSQDAGTAPLVSAAEQSRARRGGLALTRTLEEERERVLAAPLPARRGWIAVAGVSLEELDATLHDVVNGLLIGGGGLVLLSAAGAYWMARAALSPVERLRREVAALSGRDTQARVRVPGTRDEIAALAGTMNDLLGRLDRARVRERAFVADASHELRTPIAVLHGELELAGRPGRSRDELAAAVAAAADEVTRLTRITDDLLLLARGDEEELRPHREPVDVRLLLADSAERVRAPARAVGVTCQVLAAAGLEAVVDPGLVQQAVGNLIDNAVRFAPPGTTVMIAARATDSGLVIEVADSGPGFPPGFLPHAFERFRRPDSGRSRSDGGAGLGLAIASAVAAAHGGRATAANRPAGGAAVTLVIPGAPPAPPS